MAARYIVGIGRDHRHELVARVQNVGLRSDPTFRVGQAVNLFWDAENARILTE